MAEILPDIETFARIKVVGLGGGGTNALNRMIQSKIRGIEFIAINTDAQALHYSQATKKVHIGKETTKGLGAGANPETGRLAAEESEEEIYEALKNSEMVFITCGMGGGTGSGAISVVSRISKEVGALTVAIVTKPFTFEGERRRKISEAAIDDLRDKVDTLIVIPNDRILQIIDRKTSLLEAFGVVDDVLRQGVQGISDLITVNGLVNLDFADVKSIMNEAGSALMGIGNGAGDDRAVEAVKEAMDSPLLEVSIKGAKGVLINFTGGRDMGMHEIEEAAKLVHDAVDPEANIIWGTVLDENMNNEIKVTLVATGFESPVEHSRSNTNKSYFGSFSSSEETKNESSLPFLAGGDTPRAKHDEDIKSMIDAEPIDEIDVEEEIESFVEEKSDNNDHKTEEDQKPIVETLSTPYDEDNEYSHLEEPAFLRKRLDASKTKKAKDSIPSIVKKKLK